MKKIFLLLAASLFFVGAAYCDGKVIEFGDLPLNAQQFIKKFFPKEQLAYVKSENNIVSRDYEVKMMSGTELSFDKNGNWTEIDCAKRGKVPGSLISPQIMSYVKQNYKGAWVTGLDKSDWLKLKKYEVKLSNGLSLEFDKNFNIKDIDD